MNKQCLYLFLAVFVLAGCANSRIEKSLNTWIGASEADVVEAYGAPDKAYSPSPGVKVLSYTRSSTYSVPISSYNQFTGWTHGAGSMARQNHCLVNFTVKYKKVLKYTYQNDGDCGFVSERK